jgi:hypothetical protein
MLMQAETETRKPGGYVSPIAADPSFRDPERERQAGGIKPESQAYFLNSLSASMLDGYAEARHHRETEGIDDRLVECLRTYNGKYSDRELALIREQGGTEAFRRLTTHKCDDLGSWLKDVMRPSEEPLGDLEPTPIPDLPDDVRGSIVENVLEQMQGVVAQAAAAGKVYSDAEVQALALGMAADLYDQAEKMIAKESKDRAARCMTVIKDQWAEGGWIEAFMQFLDHFKLYPTAFIRGPFLARKKMRAWRDGRFVVTNDPILQWAAPSPFNIYPSPNASNCQGGVFYERDFIERRDLYGCIGAPGYNEDAIRRVLSRAQSGVPAAIMDAQSDAERAALLNRPIPYERRKDSLLEAVRVSGSYPGYQLQEWGMPVADAEAEYDIFAMMVGSEVVKAVLNEDPLGRRPYSAASFKPVPGAFWGMSLPEAMEDIQKAANSMNRHAINNGAMASGPVMTADVSALPVGFDLKRLSPWAIMQYDGQKLRDGTRKPFEFHDIPNAIERYMAAYGDFKKEADDVTGIPAFISGSGETEGAGETARGLAMLMESAAKGIREAIVNISIFVVCDMMQRQFDWIMRYHADESVKGDCRITPRGPLAVIAKAQMQTAIGQALIDTANPIDMAIIGPRRRANLLRKRAYALNMEPDDLVPPDDEMRQREEAERAAAEAQAQAVAAGVAQPQPAPGQEVPA